MRENGLNPRRRRRTTRTTDSDHGGPIFPFIAKEFEVYGPDQLWVADLTYITIAGGFVYATLILDAWSRRVLGCAIGRSIDARLAVRALRSAIAEERRPLPGCVFHTDRGSQYASELHRGILAEQGFFGSMSRSTTSPPACPGSSRPTTTAACIQPWAISALHSSKIATPAPWSKPPPDNVHPQGRTPIPVLATRKLRGPDAASPPGTAEILNNC